MPPRQKLPPAGSARELLQQKGQFWTPDWVAEAMVAYLLAGGHDTIFDPAVGAGAFFHAAKLLARETGRRIALRGTEIDPLALEQAQHGGLSSNDVADVHITDFVLHPPTTSIPAIVANPPYVRHHRLSNDVKQQLKAFSSQMMGIALDGRAGFHNYFLLRALSLLAPSGRLAFIMPADTVEGVSSQQFWSWITSHYCLDAVITFAPDATPFPGVDTNALIFLIRNAPPADELQWVRCSAEHPLDLKAWLLSDLRGRPGASLHVQQRSLAEGLATGLSREPQAAGEAGYHLSDFARVMRGIATGDNDYFFLTQSQASSFDLPAAFLRPALGRTRDVQGSEITAQIVQDVAQSGRPTLLFAPDGRPISDFPPSVQAYIQHGIEKGLPDRPLISQRHPWYKMETRTIPPFFFAYLGRRSARFIRNRAGVLPLTCFLCVYAHQTDETYIEQVWYALSHPKTLAHLSLVGKSYGSGAIKVEPRALERLFIPQDVVEQAGLVPERRPGLLQMELAL